jgi:hypothetical protein
MSYKKSDCHAHEEQYINYCIQHGSGTCHASHHSNPYFCVGAPISSGPDDETSGSLQKPIMGAPGSSQYLSQTWVPNAADDHILVTLQPDTFLQIDLTELGPGNPTVTTSASLSATGGLAGSVTLFASLGTSADSNVSVSLTGALKGASYNLMRTQEGVVVLQFSQPLSWNLPGQEEDFDIELDGSTGGPFPQPSNHP